jgi:hypothetical protein
MHHLEPSRTARFADDDLGDVVCGRIGEDLLGDVAARDGYRRSAEPLGEPQKIRDAIALSVVETLRTCGLDTDRGPRRSQVIRHPPRIAD